MAGHDAHLHEVLDGYAKFLQDKDLALDKHQPYLVRWVRDFLWQQQFLEQASSAVRPRAVSRKVEATAEEVADEGPANRERLRFGR